MPTNGVVLDGEKIRKLRQVLGMKQSELGDRAGVNRATINRIEKNEGYGSSYETAEGIAKVFGLDPLFLLKDPSPDVLLVAARAKAKEAVPAPSGEAVADLSDAGGVALAERVASGETEEVRELEDRYLELLPRYAAGRGDRDVAWTVEGYERDLAQALAALAAEDRDEGAEAIQQTLRRIRESGE